MPFVAALLRASVQELRASRELADFLGQPAALVLSTGYHANLAAVAALAGRDALCDTNGGMLPGEIADVVHAVREASSAPLGIHCHNDTGCAVANSLAAVDAGVVQVQGTLNGYGERTGNADLLAVVANLELKLGRQVLPAGRLAEATRIAHAVSEVTNVPPYSRQPYVGASAFAHKAGLHASAIKVDPDLYQHADPTTVGNDMRMLVSDMAGRASIELKGRELGYDLAGQGDLVTRITERVKSLEAAGYTFEAADASFELLLREEADGVRPGYFDVESWRVITESRPGVDALSEATPKVIQATGGKQVPWIQSSLSPASYALRPAASLAVNVSTGKLAWSAIAINSCSSRWRDALAVTCRLPTRRPSSDSPSATSKSVISA